MNLFVIAFIIINLHAQTPSSSGGFVGALGPSVKSFYQKYAQKESVQTMIKEFDNAMSRSRSADWRLAMAKQSFALKFDLEGRGTSIGEVDMDVYKLRFKLLDEFLLKYNQTFPEDKLELKDSFYLDAKKAYQQKLKEMAEIKSKNSNRNLDTIKEIQTPPSDTTRVHKQ